MCWNCFFERDDNGKLTNEFCQFLQQKMYRFFKQSFSHEEAEDLTQELSLKINFIAQEMDRGVDKYRIDRQNVKNYIYQCAGNKCIDYFRKKDRKKSVKAFADDKNGQKSGDSIANIPKSLNTIIFEGEKYHTAKIREIIEDCIRDLSPELLDLWLLRMEEGLTIKNIQQITGISEKAQNNRIAKAKLLLAKCIKPKLSNIY